MAVKSESEKYDDIIFTSWLFIISGGLCLIFTLLNLLGVIKLFYKSYFSLGVFGAVGAVFVGIGIYCHSNAWWMKNNKCLEYHMQGEIEVWLRENISKEKLIEITEGLDEYEAFFTQLDYLKEEAGKQFPDIKPGFLERLCEDYYDELF